MYLCEAKIQTTYWKNNSEQSFDIYADVHSFGIGDQSKSRDGNSTSGFLEALEAKFVELTCYLWIHFSKWQKQQPVSKVLQSEMLSESSFKHSELISCTHSILS